ncbi:uncharacterized protein LOC116785940 [Chiroxiphia lanceolata]|uniref:uncharacterized protein LOC116785940 n=1 Tax=Chiroxiphia lanceolata TaxID=296741 RepID=UPI0013CEC116|nr:uncharacterized protein LOC116785940 [Chiroxiphia lanceolata]
MATKKAHDLSILSSPILTRCPANQPGRATSAVQSPDRRPVAVALACPPHPARAREGWERKAEEGEESERRRPGRSRETGLSGATGGQAAYRRIGRWRGAGLAALAAVLLVSAGRAQVQQDQKVETTEGSEITIKCSHANLRMGDFIPFYRQLPGHYRELLARVAKGSRELRAPAGRLSLSEDGLWTCLLLSEPRAGDAALYSCALADTDSLTRSTVVLADFLRNTQLG